MIGIQTIKLIAIHILHTSTEIRRVVPEIILITNTRIHYMWGDQMSMLCNNPQPRNIKGYYRKTSYISRTLVGNKIVDNSDVVGASPVGAAPTTSSFST